ncbi:MAG TPA: hypothetical protein VFZ19_12715, partial [Solirubrobacterales bacterium]
MACEFALKFGGESSGPGRLDSPNDLATDTEGNVWVLDTGHSRVQKFDPEGKFLLQFGSSGTGIAVDSEGDVWITAGGDLVKEFSDEGAFLRSWSVPAGFASL